MNWDTIEIPTYPLIQFCGGWPENTTAVDLGKVVKNYLYGAPHQLSERKTALGRFLVDILEAKLSK